VDRFEDAWRRGERPPIEDYLPTGKTDPELLAQLVHADLEFRLNQGELVRVEAYLERYPELTADRGTVVALIEAEYYLRRLRDPALTPQEYRERFSQYADKLRHLEPGPAAELSTAPDGEPPKPARRPDPAIAAQLVDDAAPTESSLCGPVLSGYEGLEELGRGGMGVVYKARHTRLKRIVAVKMIRAGSQAGPEELARFRREAEAVAHLQHANIVQIYEVGEHQGQPYLSLEFVDGGSLEEKLARSPLPAHQAAALVETLARAMYAAHQKGILHRDLKPANVLLMADGTPKITDFGLAKRLDVESAQTRSGALIGTPSYMAPEQATWAVGPIGPPTDVYGLGAILYETLTGRPPFRGASILETLEQVRKEEPVAPGRLQPKLPRDLETICLKCLQKQPRHRYASAEALGDDLRRFLNGEAIRARPAPLWERAWKWTNRRPTAAALLGVSVLAAMILLMGWLQFTAQLKVERDAATKERDRAEAVANFLVEAFRHPNPFAGGGEMTITDRLNQAAARLEQEFSHDPVTKAQLLDALGQTYFGLGLPAQAVGLLEQARTIRQTVLGVDHPDTLGTMSNLAVGYGAAGRLPEALPLFEETLQLRKAKLGPDHPDTLTSMHNLATAYRVAGRLSEALPLHEETLQLTKAKLGPDHPSTLFSMSNLAQVYRATGRLKEALPLYEETLQLMKAKLGPDHPDTLTAMNNLAGVYMDAGLHEALPLLEEVLKLMRTKLGPDHPNTVTAMNSLAEVYRASGRLKEALPLYEATLQLRKAQLGPDHSDTLTAMNNLAVAYGAADRLPEALPLYELALQLRKAKLGPDHPDTLTSMNNLAEVYRVIGRVPKALPLFEETLKLMKAKLGLDHPDTLTSMNNLALAYQAANRLPEALPLHEETLKLRKAKLGLDHPSTLISMSNLASAYRVAGRLQEALPLLEATLQLRKAKLGPDHPDTLRSMNNLAVVYREAGRLKEALPLHEEALQGRKTKLGVDHPDTLQSMGNLAAAYQDAGKFAQSEALLSEALAQQRRKLPADSPELAATLATLGDCWLKQEKFAQAEPHLRECLTIRQKKRPEHWSRAQTQSLLGASLVGQKKYAEAEPLLLDGYEGLKARAKDLPAPAQKNLTEALDRLIRLYEDWGQADKAARWRAQRDKETPPAK
jgi:tetratricopeptide (TPR) repeat protein/predicted Ser/Thr protein kinase